jgi:hypothetical protein
MRILIIHPKDTPTDVITSCFFSVVGRTYKHPDILTEDTLNDELVTYDIIASWDVLLSMPAGHGASLFSFNHNVDMYRDDHIVLFYMGTDYSIITDADIQAVTKPTGGFAPLPTNLTVGVVGTLAYMAEVYKIDTVEKVFNIQGGDHDGLIIEAIGVDQPTQLSIEQALWGDIDANADTDVTTPAPENTV